MVNSNQVLINKVNFGNQPHISVVLEPYLQTIAEGLAGKLLKESDAVREEIDKLLFSFQADGVRLSK